MGTELSWKLRVKDSLLSYRISQDKVMMNFVRGLVVEGNQLLGKERTFSLPLQEHTFFHWRSMYVRTYICGNELKQLTREFFLFII